MATAIDDRQELLEQFQADISMSEKSDHHILNFKSDRSHSDSMTVRNEREVDEVPLANIFMIPEESIESRLSKPTYLRAFIQFDSQFTEKKNDIFVTLRWNQPEFTDEIIQGYQVQCSFFDDFKETCDDKNITAAKLEHTVHNLTSNTTYYFRVRAHTKIVAGPYTDLINVSITHENPIPKLLLTMDIGMEIMDVDLNITNLVTEVYASDVIYSIQDNIIYWIEGRDLMTLKINENNITKMATFDNFVFDLCFDWVARNLYFTYYVFRESGYYCIVKFDLTMWENGIIKFEEIIKSENLIYQLSVSPFMGILYGILYIWENKEYDIMKYHLEKNEQIVRINASFCLFHYKTYFLKMIIDDMNNEEPLIYWLSQSYMVVTDINISMCNTIHKENISDNIDEFISMTIDKTNIYILAKDNGTKTALYVLKKKYASLKSVSNADKYVEQIIMSSDKWFNKICAFDKSLQPYPPMRCLTPDEKVYNFEYVNAKANSISVSLPEPVVKSGCKKYNLPTTIYTISVSCLDNNLNKSEKFNVLTAERYYEIQNLIPFTEYKLKFTLSNFYFDQLSINPFDSNVIPIKTNSGKPNAPENISVLALTPTIAVVHWIPLEKVNCMAVTYEVHWNLVTLVNGTQQKSKQFINVQKRTADGRFFTKINLSLPVQDYLIYVRVYPINFSNFYNETKIVYRYSEPNNITLSGVNSNSMNISWISNINLTIYCALEYKDIAAEKWQTMNYIKINYSNEIIYRVEKLQLGTLYKFRLILRYPEYEEYFIWPADERFNFSTLESSLSKPISLRAFVQFDSQFTEKVNIFVTLRWNQPEFTDEIIQGYQVQCSFFDDFKETCDDKNITAAKLEHTVHNLTSNTTYYFRVRAHTKIVAGPYTDLINVSTTHENPIPKLLLTMDIGMEIMDVDLNITNFLMIGKVRDAVYSIQDNRIYWTDEQDLMTFKINENNITKMATFDYYLYNLCIDWVARNLYFTQHQKSANYCIVKFDLTMWKNGIIKFEEMFKSKNHYDRLYVSPSMGILYSLLYNFINGGHYMIQYLDGKNEQIVRINVSFCQIHRKNINEMIIDDMNNEEPLIYWLSQSYMVVTDINISMCNTIHKENISDNIDQFISMTIDKTNIYILGITWPMYNKYIYVLKKKYASLKSVSNADKYVEQIIMSSDKWFNKIYAFDKSLQPYPPMRCLTPDEKVYNFENVNAKANSISVSLPEPVVKSGCKKYNLPTTIYTISVSCLDNNLNKSEKFNVLTAERYYEIQNLIPFTEYKLKFTLSNFYFDQLSINPFDSNVIPIKTNSGKPNAPENISVLALTPTIAVVHWIPLEKVNCMAVTYEVHWNLVTLVNGTQQKSKQFINVQKRTADGRFFTKINLSLPVQDYLIYVRVYPINFSNFYNETKIVYRYSEPNNITLSGVNSNSMNISWISNINLTIYCALEYKDIAAEKWQTMNYIKINYSNEIIYRVEKLQLGTLYKFRLILRYPEYEEYFIWPADERFNFSTLESSLSKPISLRAFVQFDSQFTEKVNDIFVTLRWNQPEFTDEILQGYTVQCFFIEDLKEIQTCDDTNITTTKLELTVHNLISDTTYYFRVRAHTKIVAGPYTDLINVSTTHENPIPKLLLITDLGLEILDVDLNIINLVTSAFASNAAYSIQDNRIYWIDKKDLMTLKINENKTTKIASFHNYLHNLCIDWVARNLYYTYEESGYSHIVKFDLTMWENGIIKFNEILKAKIFIKYLIVSPFMGILYSTTHEMNGEYRQYHLDGKNEQIVRINSFFCIFHYINIFNDIKIDDMNNEEPLIYWLSQSYMVVTDINISMCNTIHKENISDNIDQFISMTIDKTNIYILGITWPMYNKYIYVLKKKYASPKSVSNADKYVEQIIMSSDKWFNKIYAFDKSLQPYPPMRCLTPDEKVNNLENVNTTANSIVVNLPEPVVKSGCKKYNLPITVYNISVSHCSDNNLNKSEKFNVQTYERYYEIQNLTPFTEYKLKFTLSNFYFDQLSINPLDSNVIRIRTNLGKLNAPENISVLALTPTIAVVHWMPPKKLNCVAVTYEVHWKSVTLVNGTQQEGKQLINVPKRIADGRFFTKINLSLPVQNYMIYARVYPINFSDLYNESLNKIAYIYLEPNNITLSGVNINSIDISWISNINLTIFCTLEYKDIAAEKWQTMNYIKTNYSNEIIYRVEKLQLGTLYKFRLILRYPEYEENFTWPADERFIFSTLGVISNIPEITDTKYYLPLMLSFIVIVTIICVCYFYRLYRQRRGNNEQFLSSTMNDVELAILHEVPCRNTQFNMIYSPMLHYNPDECAITKVARKQITFTKLLGSGAFGKVFQGNVKNLERSGTEISVAIKMLRKDASSNEKKKFLKEAELMNHFRHKHILRLLAVCLDGDSPLLVLELIETGDLLKYLRDCRNLQASDSSALRLQDLLAMCEDVARGCCYLEELRFVHRDLACRNCLVSSRNRENRVIKIGDFGLARDIYKDDYYRVKGEGLFPIRWMAPESLTIGIFTSQSDVWSFGVLMWEITSLGEQPYIGKTDEQVINYIRAGGRLPITLNCPSTLYQLMLRCWSTADARPNFKLCLKNIIALRRNIEDALLNPVDII